MTVLFYRAQLSNSPFCKVSVIMGLILWKGVKKIKMNITCPLCGTQNDMPKEINPNLIYRCNNCNSIIAPKDKVEVVSQRKVSTKYYALRIIANILQILAYIVGIIGIIVSIVVSYGSYDITRFLSGTGAVGSLLIALGGIVVSVIVFIAILAQAEIIKLFIDVEANTRSIEINTRPKNT